MRRALFTFALACATGCLWDWSTPSVNGQGAQTCPAGGCVFNCTAGQTCDSSCPGGNCVVNCDPGSTCTSSCVGGGCIVNCSSGATCTSTCLGGGCRCNGTCK